MLKFRIKLSAMEVKRIVQTVLEAMALSKAHAHRRASINLQELFPTTGSDMIQ